MRLSDHHLYVVDVISEDDQPQELVPCEVEDRKKGDETAQSNTARMVLQRKRPHYYDKQQ